MGKYGYVGKAVDGALVGMTGGLSVGVGLTFDTGDGKLIAAWTIAGMVSAGIVYPTYEYLKEKWA